MALDKGDCPLGRGMGEGLPVGAAAGVLLIVWSGGGVCVCVGGISWGLSQLYPKTDKMRDTWQ